MSVTLNTNDTSDTRTPEDDKILRKAVNALFTSFMKYQPHVLKVKEPVVFSDGTTFELTLTFEEDNDQNGLNIA